MLDLIKGRTLDKAEAIVVLRKIFAVCPEIGNADFVSLDPDNANVPSKGVCKIRLRINLDNQSILTIKPVLDSHKLEMTQTKDSIIIHSPTVKH